MFLLFSILLCSRNMKLFLQFPHDLNQENCTFFNNFPPYMSSYNINFRNYIVSQLAIRYLFLTGIILMGNLIVCACRRRTSTPLAALPLFTLYNREFFGALKIYKIFIYFLEPTQKNGIKIHTT